MSNGPPPRPRVPSSRSLVLYSIGYGAHTLVIENPAGPDWIELQGIDWGVPVPSLVAVARHGANRVVLWVRHRDNLLSATDDEELTPAQGSVQIPDVPAGQLENHVVGCSRRSRGRLTSLPPRWRHLIG